jgi:hypothetical protein
MLGLKNLKHGLMLLITGFLHFELSFFPAEGILVACSYGEYLEQL